MRRWYIMYIRVDGLPSPFELARCDQPDRLAALVAAYLAARQRVPCEVTISIEEVIE